MTVEALFDAIRDSGDVGMSARDATVFLRGHRGVEVDRNSRHASPCAVDSSRFLGALAKVGLIELDTVRRVWTATAAGVDLPRVAATAVTTANGSRPPLLDRLAEIPPEEQGDLVADPRVLARQLRAKAVAERLVKLRSVMSPEQAFGVSAALGVHAVDDWRIWLPSMFPKLFTADFGEHHTEFWDWVWAINAGETCDPFVGIWNRGGAKSASAEAGLVALAARGRRKYALYVSGTQNLADEHVANIGSLLESPQLGQAYPQLGQRAVGKYGASQGWRRNRLRTEAGFTVDALGLDVAARGARIDEQRPDLIVLDDVDSENDTPASVEKKIRTITRKLLPAGSQDCVVIAIQNVIHSNSIFARLGNQPGAPRADFLARRHVSGPIPAVWDLEWAQEGDSYRITGGRPSWSGMGMDACQSMLDRFGLTAFLVECQHEEADLSGGMFDHLNFEALRVTRAEVPVLKAVGCWVDPAVTAHDRSDSCGIVVDGLGIDRRYYRLWSWERVSSPVDTLKVAILAAVEFGAQVVGVETDQGGDTWHTVYQAALKDLMDSGQIADGVRVPRFESAKAGATRLSKADRAARMLADYELGRFRHVEGGCGPLEAGLRRFPAHKPFDCVDACMVAGTLVLTEHGDVPIESVMVGDRVWTREGWRSVVASGPTAWDVPTVEVSTDQGSFRCTADHRVWTIERGWVPAAEVGGLSLVGWTRDDGSWESLRKSSTEAVFTGDTRMALATLPSTTTPRATARVALSHSTGRSISTLTAPSPTDIMSTTSTLTRSTTTRSTWWRSLRASTNRFTAPDGPTRSADAISTTSGRWRQSGIGPLRAANGIESTGQRHGLVERSISSGASSVTNRSGRWSRRLGSVLSRAATGRGGQSRTLRRNDSVSSAADCSLLSVARPPASVVSGAATVRRAERAPVVYDLEVEGCHEFVAGGLLVHNSFWSWRWCADKGGERVGAFRAKAPRGAIGEISAGNIN